MRGIGVLSKGLLPVLGEVGIAYILQKDNIRVQEAIGSL
jgi:hypothetical protein